MTATIVLLDPDPAGRHRTGELLERAGFRVRPHGDAAAALAAAAALDVDAVVWAERGPEAGGLEPLRAYRRRSPAAWTPVVVLAPAGDAGAVARVLDAGADDCLPEVAAPALLVATLRARLRPRLASVLRGDLATSPFARLTQLCHRAGLTGALEVQGDRVEFAAGSVVPAE